MLCWLVSCYHLYFMNLYIFNLHLYHFIFWLSISAYLERPSKSPAMINSNPLMMFARPTYFPKELVNISTTKKIVIRNAQFFTPLLQLNDPLWIIRPTPRSMGLYAYTLACIYTCVVFTCFYFLCCLIILKLIW